MVVVLNIKLLFVIGQSLTGQRGLPQGPVDQNWENAEISEKCKTLFYKRISEISDDCENSEDSESSDISENH